MTTFPRTANAPRAALSSHRASDERESDCQSETLCPCVCERLDYSISFHVHVLRSILNGGDRQRSTHTSHTHSIAIELPRIRYRSVRVGVVSECASSARGVCLQDPHAQQEGGRGRRPCMHFVHEYKRNRADRGHAVRLLPCACRCYRLGVCPHSLNAAANDHAFYTPSETPGSPPWFSCSGTASPRRSIKPQACRSGAIYCEQIARP